MDYIELPRTLIYKNRTSLIDFGVTVEGSLNYQLFSTLKEIYLAADKAQEIMLRCFNNAYYICTLIPLVDLPDIQVAKYEELLLNGDAYAREEICAVSMAMVTKLMPAIDDRWSKERNGLINAINYRFTHYQWMHMGARESFEKMVEGCNCDGFFLTQNEFAPRDIIEVIETFSERNLQAYAEYICERLALLEDPRQRMYGADKVIARLRDYLSELCEDCGYDPKEDYFKYEDNLNSFRNLNWEISVRDNYQKSKEAIDYYIEHYPSKEKNDFKEENAEPPQTSETEVLQKKNKELESKLERLEEQLKEAHDANAKQIARNNELEVKVSSLQDELKEAHTIPETVSAQQRARMKLAGLLMEKAGITNEVLSKWGNKDKAGTLMATLLDIVPTTCKTYLSDPCLNYKYHEETVKSINSLLKELGLEFRL